MFTNSLICYTIMENNGGVGMNIVKKILPLFALGFMLFIIDDSALAKGSYEINSLEELKSEITDLNNIDSSKERDIESENVVNNTNPQILEQYEELLRKDLKNLNGQFIQHGDSLDAVYDLPESGGVVKISTSTELVGLDDLLISNTNTSEIVPFANISRTFGSYSYKAKYTIENTLWPDATLGLVTNYKVASNGLTATTCSNVGTKSGIATDITASCEVTDSRAEKVGYDINAQGSYKIVYGLGGINPVTQYATMTSRVYWNFKGTSAQSVNESFTVDY